MENDEAMTRDAIQALAAVTETEHARAVHLRAPLWYWHTVGIMFILIEGSLMLPFGWRIAADVLAAMAGGAALGAYQSSTGFRGSMSDKSGLRLAAYFIALVGGIALIAWLISSVTDWRWMPLVAGLVTYGAIVVIGPRLEKVTARS